MYATDIHTEKTEFIGPSHKRRSKKVVKEILDAAKVCQKTVQNCIDVGLFTK